MVRAKIEFADDWTSREGHEIEVFKDVFKFNAHPLEKLATKLHTATKFEKKLRGIDMHQVNM
jgi:hypothetical protein